MSAHDDARRAVVRTLRNVPDSINFTLHTFNVTSARLQAIGRAVCENRIQVRYLPHQGDVAVYRSDADQIRLPFRHATDFYHKAQIIHEATHALADVDRANWMCIQTSEAAAHIAQSLYMIRYRGRTRCLGSTIDANDRVFATAWAAAIGVLDRAPNLYSLMRAARTSVSGHTRYGAVDQGAPRAYNGLSRAASLQCASYGQ